MQNKLIPLALAATALLLASCQKVAFSPSLQILN